MKRNNIPIFSILTFLLVLVRILLVDNPSIVLWVAIINLMALLIVIVAMIERTKKTLSTVIDDSGVPLEIAKRETDSIKSKLGLSIYIVFVFLSSVYVIWFRSALGNDIISFLAVGLSLADTQIVAVIVDHYKKHYHIGGV